MCEDLTIKNISGDLYRPIFLLSRMHTYSSLALCSLVRKQVQQRKLKTAKTPGKRTREKTSIFLAANLKLVNQADTRFVGILNRNIRICHFLDPNTLIAKTKSLKKQRALYRKNKLKVLKSVFTLVASNPAQNTKECQSQMWTVEPPTSCKRRPFLKVGKNQKRGKRGQFKTFYKTILPPPISC